MVVPYSQGPNKCLKNMCSKGVPVHFKGGNTIRKLLLAPRTGMISLKKVG